MKTKLWEALIRLLSYLKDMTDKTPVSVGQLEARSKSAMRGIFFLWVLYFAGVTSLKFMPFRIWELSKPSFVPQTRLYGETAAKEGEFPFMIFLLLREENKRIGKCSASLLSLNWVLTAAHCVKNSVDTPYNVILVGGKANLWNYTMEKLDIGWENSVNETNLGVQERRAKVIHVHPKHMQCDTGILHDIALVELERPFNDAINIKTIRLNLDKIYYRKTCTILGWGMTPSSNMVQLNVVYEKEISTSSIGCKREIHYPVICLKSDGLSGICRGDSGSPLVCDGMVYGVASYFLTETDNCGDSIEEYYTELSDEKDWIRSLYNTGSRLVEIDFFRVFTFVFTTLWVSPKISY